MQVQQILNHATDHMQIASSIKHKKEIYTPTDWCMTIPPQNVRDSGQPIQMLTIMGLSVNGFWCGQLGEFYTGWSVFDSLKHVAPFRD